MPLPVKVPNRRGAGPSAKRAPPPARETGFAAPAHEIAAEKTVKQKVPPPPSKVVEAVKRAEETLQKIKDEEQKEEVRARGGVENKVLGSEVDWLQYLKPNDTRDIDECAKIDEYNHGVQEYNNAMAPKVNELMRKLGRDTVRVEAPTKYVPIARQKYEEMLFNEEFRLIRGIKFLAERNQFPVRDYTIEEAPDIADKCAFEDEQRRLIELAGANGIDISGAAGPGHKNNCTCENRWDGTSERCKGVGVRLRWRRGKDHHFLRPRVVIEQF